MKGRSSDAYLDFQGILLVQSVLLDRVHQHCLALHARLVVLLVQQDQTGPYYPEDRVLLVARLVQQDPMGHVTRGVLGKTPKDNFKDFVC